MREIKFRAWDGKMMIDDVWTWDKSSNHFGHYNEFHENWMYGLGVENVTLMQFTGLKDKTGKEIYEGDRIAGTLFDYRVTTMGEIVYDSEHACYTNKNNAGLTPLSAIDQIEVIGNIYENPELVKSDG